MRISDWSSDVCSSDLETVSIDEQPGKAQPEKIPTLKPAFVKDGTITAANASPISDGATALVMTRASVPETLGLCPVAPVVAHAAHAHQPGRFTARPAPARQQHRAHQRPVARLGVRIDQA